ncbi:MAG TPA: hypothetical protein VMJ64_18845 [Anaerolineales bacterium]|nr:hypothetical protein [Anaerolineales bacterium]
MNNEQPWAPGFPALVIKRPFSSAVAVMAALVILVSLVLRLGGHMLIGQLNNMDAFTPVMISILLLRGLYAMRNDTDLQAVSIALIGALSFIFIYEAIYKLSFYIVKPMPPEELREFLIQMGTALTALAGFAFGKFHFSRWSMIFTAAFVALYAFWMLTGYPQVNTTANVYWVIIPVRYTWDMIYAVNRGTKVLVFLTYLFFYSKDRAASDVKRRNTASAQAAD